MASLGTIVERYVGATNVARGWMSRRKWRQRASELFGYWLLPFGCALLPWRFTLRLLRFLSRWSFWFADEVALATRYAHRAGFAPDPEVFARRLRWRMLIDYADGHLVAMRGEGYLRRYVRVSGDALPSRGPLVFVSCHHGCGFWFLPFARRAGLPPSIVAPRPGPLLRHASLMEHLFMRLRFVLLARAAGTPLVIRGEGNAGRELESLLEAGRIGFGLCDMPTTRTDAVEVDLCGRRTKLAQNMFELARAKNATIVLFHSDTDLISGERHIRLQRLADDVAPEDAVRAFATMLDAAIKQDPSGWRFWSIAPSFFTDLSDDCDQA